MVIPRALSVLVSMVALSTGAACGGSSGSTLSTSPRPLASSTPQRLSKAAVLSDAAALRRRALPAGFQHDETSCPPLGNVAPIARPQSACYRTRATFAANTTARGLATFLAPLQVTLVSSTTSCAPTAGPFGRADVCTSLGKVNSIPVSINLLLRSQDAKLNSNGAWTYIKFQVVGSVDVTCPSAPSTCVVAG